MWGTGQCQQILVKKLWSSWYCLLAFYCWYLQNCSVLGSWWIAGSHMGLSKWEMQDFNVGNAKSTLFSSSRQIQHFKIFMDEMCICITLLNKRLPMGNWHWSLATKIFASGALATHSFLIFYLEIRLGISVELVRLYASQRAGRCLSLALFAMFIKTCSFWLHVS